MAVALIVTCPLTVIPFEGAVRDTTGGADGTLIVKVLVTLSAVAERTGDPARFEVLVKAKVALAEPLAMITDTGTESAELLELRVTVFAADPGPAIVTVHVPDCPGDTVDGVQAREIGPAVAVTTVVTDDVPAVAVRVTGTDPVKIPVLAVNVALVAFAATVTLDGRVRTLELSESVTTAPPDEAGLESVTVHEVLALVARTPAPHCTLVMGLERANETVV